MLKRFTTSRVARWSLAAQIVFAAGSFGAAAPLGEADLYALSGINTTESDELDKQANKLVEQSIKTKADAAAAMKAAAAKIDPKKLLEALKRGQAIQPSAEEQHARELSDRANELAKQAHEKAKDAAAKRSRVALERRCLAPVPPMSPATAADPLASPYLCPAVRAGGSATDQNDPWELCSCIHRYLLGLQADYESLLKRAQSFVGQRAYLGYGSDTGVITTGALEEAFRRRYVSANFTHLIESTAGAFEQDARAIQQDLARGRVQKALDGRSFRLSEFDHFQLSKNGAYSALSLAGELWTLYKTEAGVRLAVLQSAKEARTKEISDKWDALDEATFVRHPEYYSKDDATAFIAEMRPLGLQNDERDYAYIADTAKTLRMLAAELRDTFQRFEHDMKDWANYAIKDGQRPKLESVTPPQPIKFEISATRRDPVHCCFRIIERNGQLYDDSETHVWAHFPQDLLQAYPEIRLSSSQTSVLFQYAFVGKGLEVSGVASGADDTQRP